MHQNATRKSSFSQYKEYFKEQGQPPPPVYDYMEVYVYVNKVPRQTVTEYSLAVPEMSPGKVNTRFTLFCFIHQLIGLANSVFIDLAPAFSLMGF